MNITRLATCSPVATAIGATARAIVAIPSTSSGDVGSSIQRSPYGASRSNPVDRVGDVPALVGVDRQLDVGSDRVANEAHAALVVGEVGADLELDQREPVGDGLACQPLDLGVVVAQPTGRGGVRRVAVLEQTLDAFAATRLGAFAGSPAPPRD